MIRQFISAASLIALVACGQGADKADHGVSTDPNAATGFITSNTVAPETATVREGETIARDADGRPYSYALLGEPLPALTGQMADGTSFDPASLDGTWNVIDVWGIWCGDCMADAPYVAALVTAIEQDPDLGFLSIHTPANANRATPSDMYGKYGSVSAYFEDKGYSYPTLLDEDASLRDALAIKWTPSYLLVDPNGVVRGFRTDLSVAEGEPVKDFLKDVARVKAETKKASLPEAPLATIGPDGAASLSGAIPFNTNAIRAAFPGFEVVPDQMQAEGQTYPVFKIVADSQAEAAFVLEPDWSLGQVQRVTTTHPDVAGPGGERVGSFTLDQLTDAQRETCQDGVDEAEGLLICTSGDTGARFQWGFATNGDTSQPVLARMMFLPELPQTAD